MASCGLRMGEETSGDGTIGSKCMLAVAKGGNRVSARWRGGKRLTAPSVVVMRHRCSRWNHFLHRRGGGGGGWKSVV